MRPMMQSIQDKHAQRLARLAMLSSLRAVAPRATRRSNIAAQRQSLVERAATFRLVRSARPTTRGLRFACLLINACSAAADSCCC